MAFRARTKNLHDYSGQGYWPVGMMVDILKCIETEQRSRYLLKMLVKIGTSWSQQFFRVDGETPSGLRVFLTFCLLKGPSISCSLMSVGGGGLAERG